MNKTEAAQELGVTRVTAYEMLKDGRLAANGMGRVTTQSAAELMSAQNCGTLKAPADGRRNNKERKETLV